MNKIQKRLSFSKISESFFIHPSQDPIVILTEVARTKLFTFEIGDVRYFIQSMEKFSLLGLNEFYTCFCSSGSDVWNQFTIKLTDWEWLFLVKGFNSVNEAMFYKNTVIDWADRYISKEAYEKEVEESLNMLSDHEAKKEQLARLQRKFKPAKINEKGIWTI